MTKTTKAIVISGVLSLLFLGLREDVDYCRYTAEWRSCYRIGGLPVPFTSTHDEGYRIWLERDIGARFPQEYVDFLNFHPLLPISSTPPGNWLYLRTLKSIYDEDAASHDEVAALVKAVASRTPPLFNSQDNDAHNALVTKYLSKNDPFGGPPKKQR